MKKKLILSLMLPVLLTGCQGYDQKGSIRVMSLNIRYDQPADGANRWENRRRMVKDAITEISPDVAGFQEVLTHQLMQLDTMLLHYDYIGVGRDDGKTGGEFAPVFFKMNRLDLADHGTIWLSEHPDSAGSVGWDAELPRIATWAVFHDKHIRQDFLFVNTHFDHRGETARHRSALLILDFIRMKSEGRPVLLTGDLNLSPDDPVYDVLTAEGALEDAFHSSITGNRGMEGTFNGFGTEQGLPRIDYILTDGQWRVFEHYIRKYREEEIYISDHYPVFAIAKIDKGPGR